MRSSSLYDFDVIFLLLSTRQPIKLDEFLALHDRVANAGFHTVIATHPEHLSQSARRFRVVIVNGSDNGQFDIHTVVRELDQLDKVAIMILTEENESLSIEKLFESGADVCLRMPISFDIFYRTLFTLIHRKSSSHSQLSSAG